MKTIYILITFTALLFMGATYEEILNDKSKQIEVFKKEIEESKSRIKSSQSDINDIEREMDSIGTEINSLNDFLKDYENEKYLSPEEIAEGTNTVLSLESEVEKIQNSFKNKIIDMYKHGKNYELELLLSSKTPNEYLRRNEYLQKFALSRKKELRDLKIKKFILEEKKKMLELSTTSKRYYVELKRDEKTELQNREKELQNDKQNTENQIKTDDNRINFKGEQILIVQDFINNFIANKQNFKSYKYSRINYSSDNFSQLKSLMNLPVDLGIIRNNFGDYFNSFTKTRITNNGVDFNISKGSRVYAVANGTVSIIGDVPFFGKTVIIAHDSGFRTVYSSLSEVTVNAGDKIYLNQVIGRSGETPEGQGIHFEIWQEKTPLNPKEWIRFY